MWKLKKIWYRVFQAAMGLCSGVLPWRNPIIIKGPGSVKQMPKRVRDAGLRRILVVAGSVVSTLPMFHELLQGLKQEGVEYVLYDGAKPNPTIENVEAARIMYLEQNCQGFLVIGGGSSMDCAKAAAARVARPNRKVSELAGLFKVRKRTPPMFAVPTTAGTGSETTLAAVITDQKTHHKYALNDLSLIPHYAVLDPELTIGLTPKVTAETGMDALTHAVESYLCCLNNPKSSRMQAEESVRLIFSNLEKAYTEGTDLTARENMLEASYLAGCAFTRTGVGTVHAIAHTLGGLYNSSHGLANAVLLPYILEAYGHAVEPKLARLAEIAGIEGDATSDAEKSQLFLQEIRNMNRRMEIPENLGFIKETDIPQMIRWAMKEANPIYPVPVIFSYEDYERIIKHVRYG